MMGSERLRKGRQTAEHSNIPLKLIFIANLGKWLEISLSDYWNLKVSAELKSEKHAVTCQTLGKEQGSGVELDLLADEQLCGEMGPSISALLLPALHCCRALINSAPAGTNQLPR